MIHPVDIEVGRRIRHRRWLVEMSQKQLAAMVGVRGQQIQKYEKGENRVSASRLWEIAQAQSVSVAYYFDDIYESSRQEIDQQFDDREAVEFIRVYTSLSASAQIKLLKLMQSLAVE